jgi:sacsin
MDRIQFDNIGPREEITNRLRSLLDGYKDGLSIIKEMIQNADDAKATTVKICLDMNAQKSLLDPDSPHKQGHALYFYNDSQFEDHDFKNISLLGIQYSCHLSLFFLASSFILTLFCFI